jgi:acetyl-CoA acyltransferase
MKDVYIVNSVRTPGCRRNKGALAQTRPENLLVHAMQQLIEKTDGVDKSAVEDILAGCAFPEAEQGLNIGRVAAQMAKFPDDTCGATINRFCASGLEAIGVQASRIASGWADVCIGAGIESMSIVPMGGNMPRPHPDWAKENPDVYISMGITAENVATRYKINREQQDEFAFHSQMKAANAQKSGHFTEIVPTPAFKFVEQADGSIKREEFMQDFDDGVRDSTTAEGLGKLRPAFSATGSVTAGNSSQTTDGAAATLLMSEEAVKKYGVTPIAKFKTYVVAGCKADEMGVGPAYAVPKLLKLVGMDIKEVIADGLFELNEAFASQAIYSAQQIGIADKKILGI